jgi:hypothetical protein
MRYGYTDADIPRRAFRQREHRGAAWVFVQPRSDIELGQRTDILASPER